MSIVKDITVLAVTRMHGGVCTAGIDDAGEWVRPVRPTVERQWEQNFITDFCLLPIDFFHGGKSHLINLAVTRFRLLEPVPKPPHSEDWIIDLTAKPQLIRKLSLEEQAGFLAAHADSDLSVLDPNGNRSLALVRPQQFSFSFGLNRTGEDVTVRATFTVAGRTTSDVGCTDLRMRAIGRKLIEKSKSAKGCSLTSEDFERRGKQATYLAVGLSRLYKSKHWPIIIGVHALPELEVEIDYARL
ncbi:MAG: hypothetical protein L0229_19505 [Blastocatellia bacterium]|nr:hypothetical protein [Blastocatellia bacterium]